ncbi:hypothetical protein [Pedobacter cryophilus]|uniref:Uncharacterized protein n=1 Tax=Pedobacter cryophilus TaxID=2571271 RepID=A0A4U1C028_9SPHI|nr:hypothetical protein [Pedobacter cryophilus]TKB96270.1 hypothetical protein FA046_13870 [Pedobacter cryophilus]
MNKPTAILSSTQTTIHAWENDENDKKTRLLEDLKNNEDKIIGLLSFYLPGKYTVDKCEDILIIDEGGNKGKLKVNYVATEFNGCIDREDVLKGDLFFEFTIDYNKLEIELIGEEILKRDTREEF